MSKLRLVPITLRGANDFVEDYHRHNGRTSRDGGKWAVSVCSISEFLPRKVVGVGIVGNPLSATLMDGLTAEVLRVCVLDDAPLGTCSMIYSACWKAWQAMGGGRMITYTLPKEGGHSLKGLKEQGWRVVGETKPVKDGWRKDDHLNDKRTHSPVMDEVKYRWQVQTHDWREDYPNLAITSPTEPGPPRV